LHGTRVLRGLCKIALEPDSCVRRTEETFLRYGVRSLVVAKFIPGFSTIAPPLAGAVGVGLPRFLTYSAASALLWAGAWGLVGFLAGDALQKAVEDSRRLGTTLAALGGIVLVAYVAFKWTQRQRFLRSLRIARITHEEGLSAIIVEQHPRAILAISHRAVVLDHGTVVHSGPATELAAAPDLLDRLLGVAR